MPVFVRCVLILHKFSVDNRLNTRQKGHKKADCEFICNLQIDKQ